jgi:hypothetical protein
VSAKPIREPVAGAPFQPGDRVIVVDAIDEDVHDVSALVGRSGDVDYLEYSCGCGQSFPDDPMVGVEFADGVHEEFWSQEIRRC